MRVSNLMMTNNYLDNLNKAMTRLNKVETQMSSQKKIQKASENSSAAAQVMDYKNKLSQINLYSDNIDNGLSFIKQSISSLSQIDEGTSNVLAQLVNAKNGLLNQSELTNLADTIDSLITTIMDSANTEYQGKYIFGGTDSSTAPLGYTTDGTAVEIKPDDISGSQNVRISPTITTKVNLPGSDLFATIVSQSGNLNSGSAVGSVTNSSTQVYDATGNAYTLNISYQKTAANTYSMTYDVLDGTSTSIFTTAPAAQDLVFDSTTGKLSTIEGNAPANINVKSASKKIEFSLNLSSLTEKNSAASVTSGANQKTNIFNTLIAIRDNLKNGTIPTTAQSDAVQSFYDNLVNNESKIGNQQVMLESVQTMLTQQQTDYKELIANEMEVDVASLSIELQNMQYTLEATLKMASMILPKSLMDYL